MTDKLHWHPLVAVAWILVVCPGVTARAADQPQWGQAFTHNMVSDETGLPDEFDPATGRNVKWSVPLGTETNASPIVAGEKVLIGTNNGQPRDPRHQGHRGVLLCLDEATGRLGWQLAVPRFEHDLFLDWRTGGICSSPTVQRDRVYVVSNRAEVMCLDLRGQANGNDGPYRDEGRHMAPTGEEPLEITATDADVLWLFDMLAETGIHYHDASHSSIVVDGQYLYLNTGNGVDKKHRFVPAPEAPALIVLDKTTGRLVARDAEHVGRRIFHCSWSSPSLGMVEGNPQVFLGGADGVCYAFKPFEPSAGSGGVGRLETIWRFDCDPSAPKENVQRFMRNRRESPSNIISMPVYHDGRLYVTGGGDIWWGKNQAWLQCIDATGTGDVTQSGLLWSYALKRHCCSTPAVHDGLVFVADCGRTVHCVDAETGKPHWTHEAGAEMFGSTLVADGKVYVGTRRGDLWVFAASKRKEVIARVKLDSGTCSTPVAANGVLYVATHERLYAVEKKP